MDQIDDFLLESDIEGLVDAGIADKVREELESLLVIDKPALAFEVVGFHPGCQATEDGILDLEGLFT